MTKKVVPISKHRLKPLDKLTAQKRFNELAKTTANIQYTLHARERAKERSITLRDVERTLQEGIVIENPRLGEKGDWSYLVQYIGLEGRKREVGCVTIILSNNKLVVKTVEWIDL